MFYGPLVSKDFKATQIMVDFEPDVSSGRIFRELRTIIDEERDSRHEIHMAGRPILEGWFDFYLPAMGRIFVVTGALMIALLYLAFRSKRGVFLPFISAAMATAWGLGVLSLFGLRLDPATILVPFLILALGISHSVQFIKRYYEVVKEGNKAGPAAAEATLASLFVPALASLVTDGIGFLSLFFVPLAMIKSMALAAGVGVLSIFFTSVTFIPAILSFMPKPKRLEIEREERTNVLDHFLAGISSLTSRPPLRWTVFILFFLATLVGARGLTTLVIGDNEEGSATLYQDSPYNVAEKVINDRFTGTSPYFILVEGREEESLINHEALKEMDSLQRFLEKEVPEAGYTLSLTDYIKGLNMAMFGGRPDYLRIPEKDGTIAEYLFLYSISGFPGDFDPVVSPNFQFANIKVDFKDHRSETIRKAVDATRRWIEQFHSHDDVEFRFAGGVMGTLGAVNDIISKMLPLNIVQVTLLVFMSVAVAYMSLVAGVMLLVPLLFGVLVTFGVMGFSGITLTLETLPVAALGIGLGVDYSIYVTTRVKQEFRSAGQPSIDAAILRALVTSGKAVFFTGATVAVGVFAWTFSEIRLQARLGLALGCLIILNILGALVLLPVFLRIFEPKFISREGEERRNREEGYDKGYSVLEDDFHGDGTHGRLNELPGSASPR
jgi:predicted RND superfamily exporter protein